MINYRAIIFHLSRNNYQLSRDKINVACPLWATVVYILLLDTLLVRCSRSWDNKLNIWRDIPYQSAPKYYSLFIDWGQNSRVCHTISIQNPLKVTIFKEFQCVTVARSLSDRFSYSPAIIDCWPQKRLLMNVKPVNLLISAPAKISQG